MNVDATIFELEGYFDLAVLLGITKRQLQMCTLITESAEIIDIREALSWTQRKGQMESCQSLIVQLQAIKGLTRIVSSFGLIVEDYRLLLESLSNKSLCFVKRFINSVAHHVKDILLLFRGVNVYPPGFVDIVQNDARLIQVYFH